MSARLGGGKASAKASAKGKASAKAKAGGGLFSKGWQLRLGVCLARQMAGKMPWMERLKAAHEMLRDMPTEEKKEQAKKLLKEYRPPVSLGAGCGKCRFSPSGCANCRGPLGMND